MDDCWIKILIFVVTWVLADALGLLFWALNRWMLMAVAAFAHLYTISIASSHNIPAAVLTMFTPGFAQAYWVGAVWSETGTFWHPLSYMCVILLCSLFIELSGRYIYRKEIAEITARQ